MFPLWFVRDVWAVVVYFIVLEGVDYGYPVHTGDDERVRMMIGYMNNLVLALQIKRNGLVPSLVNNSKYDNIYFTSPSS